MSHADEIQQKLRASEQVKEATEIKLMKELGCLQQKLEMKQKEMTYRLESSEEAHQKSIQELKDLLASQHRVGAKYVLFIADLTGTSG